MLVVGAQGRTLLASRQSILRCLGNLSQDSGNFIFLISSYTSEDIKDFFGDDDYSTKCLGQVAFAALNPKPLTLTLNPKP